MLSIFCDGVNCLVFGQLKAIKAQIAGYFNLRPSQQHFVVNWKKGRQVLDASSSRFFMMKQLENCSQKCYCCPHFRSFFRWPMKKRIHQQRSTSPQFIVPLQTAEIVTEPFSLAILITRLDSSSLLKNTQKTRSVQNPNDHLFGNQIPNFYSG